MVSDTSEVKLRIRERFVVQITPAFKYSGVWPRSAAHWPLPHIPWPHPNLVAEVKTEGFDLLSKECLSLQGKQSAMEGDAWVISFFEAEKQNSKLKVRKNNYWAISTMIINVLKSDPLKVFSKEVLN